MKTVTKDLQQSLINFPDITATLFSLFADRSNTIEHCVDMINSMYPKQLADTPMTVHFARKLLHRDPAWRIKNIYRNVLKEDVAACKSRFWKKTSIRKKAEAKPDPEVGLPDMGILMDVLEKRIAYQSALNRATESGLHEDSLIAWCDVFARLRLHLLESGGLYE